MVNNEFNDPNDYKEPPEPEDSSMAWLFAGLVIFALIGGAFYLVPTYNNATGNLSSNLSTIEPAAGDRTVAPDGTTGGYTAPDDRAIPPQPEPAPANH